MRVDMVSEHASPLAALGGADAGGQNVHVAALAAALAARGHDVVVHTRRDSPDLPDRVRLDSGVEVRHVSAGPARHVPKDDLLPHMPQMGATIAAGWAAEGPPDAVHAHFWMSALACEHARAATRRRVPLAVTFHALGVVKRRHQKDRDTSPPQRLDAERAIAAGADAVVSTSRDEVRELLALGADPGRLHVVPCGVDLDRFHPEGPLLEPWTPGRHRLLSLGRLVERKGVDTAVTALVHLPGAELVVAGGPPPDRLAGDPDADPEITRLRTLARAAGVEDRVRFVGCVGRDEAAALMRAADVVIAVPWYEPFGIVPLEAMACGTPVVAAAVGGMLDTVVDHVTGRLVPPRRPQALAAALAGLLADPAARRRLGAAAVAHVRQHFTWQRVAAGTEEVYEDLAAGGRGERRAVPGAAVREAS